MFNLKGFKENSMKLMTLRQDLIKAVKKKSMRLAEASQQQQYNRGNEDLELWLSEVEGQLLPEDYGKDLTSEQNLQKKHALLEADVGAHQDRIDGIRISSEQFVNAGPDINQKKKDVLERWEKLKEALNEKKAQLGKSQTLQQFSREADKIETWMLEKLQLAQEENYKDPANIQSKHQKHQAFEAELAANADRVETVLKMGQKLIENRKCSGNFSSFFFLFVLLQLQI